MTVTVTRRDGGIDKYMRFGDTYSTHNDGTLDVFRGGGGRPYTYASGEWSEVNGDEKKSRGRFWARSSAPN